MPSPAMRHARQKRGIASRAEQIFHAKSSFVAGNPNGDVSVVTFLDYNCLYCREGAPDLAKLIARDGKVRLVLKKRPRQRFRGGGARRARRGPARQVSRA